MARPGWRVRLAAPREEAGHRPDTRPGPADIAEAQRLGEELRAARLVLGRGLEEFEAALRIRAVHLAALEEGRPQDLPGPAYALGFLRSYARALGLDAETMARRYRAAGTTGAPARPALAFPGPLPPRRPPVLPLALGAAALTLGLLGWYGLSGKGERAAETAPRPAGEQPARPAVAAPAPPPALPVPAAEAPAAARPEAASLVLRARSQVWVQVRAGQGGPVLLNRVLQPGESWTAPSGEGLLLSTGNAGALEILVEGQPVPGLGSARAVRREVPISIERLKAGPIPPPQ